MSVCRRVFPILFKFTQRFYFIPLIESQAGYFYNFFNVSLFLTNRSVFVRHYFVKYIMHYYSVFNKYLNVCSFIFSKSTLLTNIIRIFYETISGRKTIYVMVWESRNEMFLTYLPSGEYILSTLNELETCAWHFCNLSWDKFSIYNSKWFEII